MTSKLKHNIEMDKNPVESNLITFSDGEPLEDKADDNAAFSTEQPSSEFSFTGDIISADADDNDPFSSAETEPMEIPRNFTPRVRRVSDVIDSISDIIIQEMADSSRAGSTPDRVPASPLSSGYGSFGAGCSQATSWSNLPSPVLKTAPDVTDTATTSVMDATPMNEDPETPTVECIGFMPVDKYADEYNMNHKKRGKAVILNHDMFVTTSLPSRDGSNIDVDSLEKAYASLGFEVIIHNNLEYAGIKDVIAELSKEDHSDADCFILTVLTHGMGGNYLLSRDVPYSAEILWTSFSANNCITLAGKPKIFIIQACRGDKFDAGITLKDRRGSRTETDSSENSYKIPSFADFLIAYSSVEGYYSWRNPDAGTWFIQCLCKELQEKGSTLDLLKIMTRTARRVALDHESFNDLFPWQHQQKQVPSFNSMLIRDLFFRPKI